MALGCSRQIGLDIETTLGYRIAMPTLVFISDTHGSHRNLKVSRADILVHCGDWCAHSDEASTGDFLIWLDAQPHDHKVLIAGNHETWVEANHPQFLAMLAELAPSVIYLNDSGADVCGLRLWGSPVQPRFFDWSWNRDRGPDIQRHWDLIPTDTEVLITHGPPMGILDDAGADYALRRERVGCANLRTTIMERLKSLKVHAFGHVHRPGGQVEMHDGVMYVNAAVLNERYNLTHDPVVVNL